jgi:lambda repressor-like predicted transcriptional regulator
MNKALAPYQQREVDLQNSYTTLLNGRNSNLAVANQSAQALAMQAQEDQRIWNQRLQGLGFAMTTAQYRSPEQQAQLKLQTASIQNDMNLLQTSMQNDLNRYNAYATAKMKNQLQQELTDLSVEDEAQLKANLNNALSDYYKNYGDIIQRSQAQTVDDIIAYAKKNGISVAQAMTENFIKPLQNKAEYKQKIASDYGMIAKQSITSIN